MNTFSRQTAQTVGDRAERSSSRRARHLPARRALLVAGAGLAFAPLALAAPAVTLTVASFPSFDESVKLAIPLYKKLHPEVEIKLVSLGYPDHHNAMTAALATGSNLPDVMGLEINYIGKFAESKGLENLSAAPYNAKSMQRLFHPFAFPQGMDGNGAVAAIPADVGPGTLFYRKDLLDKAGVTPEQLTGTWDSFISASKTIREKTGAYTLTSAADLYTIYIRSTVQPGEGLYFDKAGRPQLDSPRFQKAFELAAAARKADIDARIAPWSTEWREAFRRGSLASQMMGAWLAGHLTDWLNPEAAGQWRAAPLPNGAFASWGGSFYAIPKTGKQKQAAWEFVKFMTTNKEIQTLSFRKMGAYPAIVEAQDKAFLNEPIPYLGGQQARLLWSEAAARIPAMKPDRYDGVAAEITAAALDDVLERNKPVAAALADANAQLKRRVRR